MRASKILLACDFSPITQTALDWAAVVAHETGATLLVVHVEPGQPTSNLGTIYRGLPDPGIQDIAQSLAALRPADPTVACEHRILRGEPAHELLKLAQDERVDVIVLGSHGHTGLKHRLLGGTAEAVLRGAHCPVMICKE